jgi:Bacterial TniB protein/TniQ
LLEALGLPLVGEVSRIRARRMARDALRIIGARVLIIDEIHALLVGGDRQQRVFLNVIRLLANDRNAIGLRRHAGGPACLLTDSGLADRFESVELPRWTNTLSFRRLLASYCAILPLRRRSDLDQDQVRAAILKPSDGITVRVARLLERLAVDAIRRGTECITLDSLGDLPGVRIVTVHGASALLRGGSRIMERGLFRPGRTLPIVPPIEHDELISSWLDRTARFYGDPLQAMLLGIAASRPVELSEVDLGTPRAALKRIAALMGISIAQLATHTIVSDYPNAALLVARGIFVPGGYRQARLRYAACPHCLEQQRIERGFSWLRRVWVLAPRTVCSIHLVALVEGQIGRILHPVWSQFLRQNQRSDRAICALALSSSALESPPPVSAEHGVISVLHHEMVSIQDTLIGNASRRLHRGKQRWPVEGRAAVIADILWAMTRADRDRPGRLVYQELPFAFLANACRPVYWSHQGPVDYVRLYIDERHLLLAIATVLTGPATLLATFYCQRPRWTDNKALLAERLSLKDQSEFLLARADGHGSQAHQDGEGAFRINGVLHLEEKAQSPGFGGN